MSTKYFEILHVLIYANYTERFWYHLSIPYNIFYSEQNGTYTMFVALLVKKLEHLNPLRALFWRQQSYKYM